MKAWIRAHRGWSVTGGAGVVALAAVVTVVLLAGSGSGRPRELPPARARVYTEQQACLLTGERGLADPAAAPVWAGMQDASARTHAKVTYLAMAGEQSTGAAGPYLATLVERKCTVVLTVGAAPDGAAASAAAKYPGARFLVVGTAAGDGDGDGGGGGGGANVTAVAGTRTAVGTAVETALAHG
ncbi:hypothetical protein OG552_20440 [Streptomyces sp. NBC_01476]|uniref:hypothetical protein n=1 Tax=Streptomyces sp. NBC_01476 TaxID=2903881 RepID=UPI002E367C4F|nr:hypothetical protein [Streptomyces sp. NBC_01476]